MILLDTNVVSELMRPEPAPQVSSWVRSRDRRELFTSSITIAEIRYGLARLADGRRKQVLLDAADDVLRAFSDQVLPVDVTAAEHYALISSARERSGRPQPDSLHTPLSLRRAAQPPVCLPTNP